MSKDNALSANSVEKQFGMTFSHIPAGAFMMGSPEDEEGRLKLDRLHRVILSKDFHLQSTHVTVAQWRRFAELSGYQTQAEVEEGAFVSRLGHDGEIDEAWYWDNPGYVHEEDFPVSCISWVDAQVFIRWLNQQAKDARYRLPTEAEWEYACRAGTTTPYNFGETITTDLANHLNRSIADYTGDYRLTAHDPNADLDLRPCAVASYAPNDWGLYDMHGNMWEWCLDRSRLSKNGMFIWTDSFVNDIVDPLGRTGKRYIARGGAWNYYPTFCRSAHRVCYGKNKRWNYVGLRLLREC